MIAWFRRLFSEPVDRCEPLMIPPALFQKWMREVADERSSKCR